MTAQPPAGKVVDFAAKPWEPNGIGTAMDSAADALINDYVLGTDEGADHEPTEFERFMLHDAYAHIMSDETFFGPVRDLLAQRTALLEALRCAVSALEWADQTIDVRGAQIIARAAIAKAVGQ